MSDDPRSGRFVWSGEDIEFGEDEPEEDAQEDGEEEPDSKKKAPPEAEEIAYDAWANYDAVAAEIGETWLENYQTQVLQQLQDSVNDGGVDLTVLDNVPDAEKELIDAWTGTPEQPGALSKILLAGMAAGNASLKQGSAANPQRPVALKAVPEAVLDIDWTLANDEAIAFIRRYALNLIRRLNRTTRKDVQKALDDWLQSGKPLSELKKELETIVKSPTRAAAIAQTESTRAYAEGAKERYQSAGVKHIEWRTVNVGLKRSVKRPGDVCKICSPLHGKTGALNEGVWSDVLQKFVFPPSHVGCRCWTVPAEEGVD